MIVALVSTDLTGLRRSGPANRIAIWVWNQAGVPLGSNLLVNGPLKANSGP
jgi:hypothetical protein